MCVVSRLPGANRVTTRVIRLPVRTTVPSWRVLRDMGTRLTQELSFPVAFNSCLLHSDFDFDRSRSPRLDYSKLSPPEMIRASCHCGAVTIDLAARPERLTSCNCSICRRL